MASSDQLRVAEFDDDDFDIVLLLAVDENPHAFPVLYRRHAAAVLRYAWSLARSESQAHDLVQETFVTLWSRRRSVRVVDESVLPWLLATCRNHALNQLRWQRRHPTVPLEAVPELPAPDPDWMSSVLDALSPEDRRLCELCLVEGLSYRDAAKTLDTAETAIGKRLQRARARLRKAVTDNG